MINKARLPGMGSVIGGLYGKSSQSPISNVGNVIGGPYKPPPKNVLEKTFGNPAKQPLTRLPVAAKKPMAAAKKPLTKAPMSVMSKMWGKGR